MWISRFKVTNFSSFSDSGWIELDPKFNLFVGRNNSGKSTLLKALAYPLDNNPHKNPECFRGSNLKSPRVEIDIRTSTQELFDRFEQMGREIYFPLIQNREHDIQSLLSDISDFGKEITVMAEISAGQQAVAKPHGSLEAYAPATGSLLVQRVNSSLRQRGFRGDRDNLPEIIHEGFGSIFHFNAERLNVGESPLNSPERLRSDAQNLPAVLAHLQGARRPVFDKIEELVIDVIGGVSRITVKPIPSGFQILTWPDKNSLYDELSFKLKDSGTGVAQVLALLTAVVTSEQAVIIIDEINSFIHPSAVKKLLHLLRSQFSHHQYIISTHSSDAIASCTAERMYIVDRKEFTSSVREINIKDADEAREVAGHLGFSMMDVFGFERIIWVEGPTEEVCFEYLMRVCEIERGSSIGFAPVGSPSELTGKNAKKKSLIDIYERAGKRLSPLLKGMAFALDREKLSDEEVLSLERAKKKLRLLPRRCLECFLLEPKAIAVVLGQLDNRDISEGLVLEMISSLADDIKYGGGKKWKNDIYDEGWLKIVDAANLLNDIFLNLTDNRVEYRKTRDGVALLKLIVEHNVSHIQDLLNFLKKIVMICLRDTKP